MANKCKLCGGQLEVLGILGWLKHLKCRACGMLFSRKIRKKKGVL